MKLNPYLVFSGNAEAAIKHYVDALNLQHTEIKRYKDSPMKHKPNQSNWVIHCELIYKGQTLAMICDAPNEGSSNQIQLSLNFDTLRPMEIAFEKMSAGGTVINPLKKQFWNATFGQFVDKFGIHWMMNCDHEKQA